MQRTIHIRKPFQAIRQLPLEVSIEQVETWIQEVPLTSPPSLWARIKTFLLGFPD